MDLKEIYKACEKYNFENLDICTKEEAIITFICHIKNISKSKFYATKNEIKLNEEESNLFFSHMDKLINGKIPIQYIIGKVNIYNEEYIVNDSVLIPRQDTEILIEKAINYINKYNLKDGLDLCCGSGVIGISVSKNSKINRMDFIDISKEALEVVKKNIKNNDLKKDTCLINSNLFDNLMTSNNKYDIIISNPPYIPTKDVDMLSTYVQKEPIIALDGGITGLGFYERIIQDARNFLNDNGYLMFELGHNQMEDVSEIFRKYAEYEIIEKVKDFNSKDRVIICRFHKI